MIWPTVPLKHVADIRVSPVDKKSADGERQVRLCNYVDVYKNDTIDMSLDFMRVTAPADQIHRFRLRAGDTVLTKDSETADDISAAAYVREAPSDLVCGYHLAIIRPTEVEPRYLYWALSSAAFRGQMSVAATGVTRFGLRHESIGQGTLQLPPRREQWRIADFLDAEIARIDQIVALRERQVFHTVEHMNATIFDAVRGAREPGPRYGSRIRWLGDLPASWAVMSVFAQFEIDLGKMLSPDRVIGKHQRPYLRNSNVQWDRIDTSDLLVMDFPPRERDRYRVREGDLLVCEGGQPGRAAIWDGRVPEIYYQKALHRVRSRGRSSVRWLFYCLQAATTMNVFAAEGNATTIAHLTGEQLKSHRFPFPPREDQDRITLGLDRERAHVSQFIEAVERQGRTLAERRQAVITAAVTGQFDVTTAGRASAVLN